MKKLICTLLALCMVLSLVACGGTKEEPKAEEPAAPVEEAPEAAAEAAPEAAAPEATGNYKIAILTGTASQGDEEITAANKLKEADPEHVITDTYPDAFASEVETTISKVLAFADDPEVKAIIFVQAVQGATAAFNQIKEERPDILLICGVPAEDPAPISAAADIVLANDEIGCGYQVADKAAEWGCDVIIHYSFARHLSYETIVAKRDAMRNTAESYGIEFVERDAPDPTGDAGASGAQAFILEDIPKVMEEYAGKKVCFYCTNCGMQVALQQAIIKEENAYYALPCCPSPFHGFQEAFGLESSYGDIPGTIKILANYLNENGACDRFSTWAVPVNMAMILGGYEYATAWAKGELTEKVDLDLLAECFSKAADAEAEFGTYTDGTTNYDNYLLVAFDPINFNDFVG